MKGLLKAYLDEPIEGLIIPDRYVHRPERLGVTIAYGEMPDCHELHGLTIILAIYKVVEAKETMFLGLHLVKSEESAAVGDFRQKLGLGMSDLHITLGWIQGSTPVSALKECSQAYGEFLEGQSFLKNIFATIEFQEFSE